MYFCLLYSDGFLDYLCGATADPNSEHANIIVGANIKTDPSHIILSPPITPPESMNTDDDHTSSFSFAEYLSKAATQQEEQSVLSVFQPQVRVKQEAGVLNSSQTVTMTTESQNTTTQYLLNLLQGQKTQQAPPAMNTKTLEQLLQEPSILAQSSQPHTVTVQQPPQVQPAALVTQQVSEVRAVLRKTAFLLVSKSNKIAFFSQSSDILLSLTELHYLQHTCKYTNRTTYIVYNNYKINNYKSITLPTKMYNNSITYTLLTIQCDYRCYLQ